jgi:hypothetical protein
MMKRPSSLLVVTLALGLTAVACGGEDQAPLSRAAFLKEGNAICKLRENERDAALKEASEEQEAGKSSREAELEEFVIDVALPPIQAMTEELDDLVAPERDEKRVEVIVRGFQNGIGKLEDDPGSAMFGTSFSEASMRAEAYGLTNCKI